MKKILMTLMTSILLLSSITYAADMSTMKKVETIKMLKDAGIESSKIKMLENGEMEKTEGKMMFWKGPSYFYWNGHRIPVAFLAISIL